MINVFLRWETCSDGIEIVEQGPGTRSMNLSAIEEGDLFARYKSHRRKALSHKLVSLNNPLVVQLANAFSLNHLESFYAEYGLEILPLAGATPLPPPPEWPVKRPSEIRSSSLVALLRLMGSGNPAEVATNANLVLRDLPISIHFESTGSAKGVSLYTNNLSNFMRWECVAVGEVGAKLVECRNCSRMFLVGPMTGRRTDARHCSDRCRVAVGRRRAIRYD